jgi:hypothetical protein
MRWFIGTLIMVNVAILLWGWLGTDEQPNGELASPGVGTIRLIDETPTASEPVAVPIPAPPRTAGAQDAEPATASSAAAMAPAVVSAMPEAQPLTEAEPAAVEPAAETITEPAAEAVAQAQSEPAAERALADAVITAPEPRYVPEPEPAPVVAALQCSRIGPFADEAAAKATRSYLAGLGQVSSHQATAQVFVGYWVLIPPQASRSAANAIGEQLKAKGIKDFWIVSKGAVKNGISLGVFSQKDNVDSFAQRIRDKGFTVEIRNKTKAAQQLWLDYSGSKAIVPAEIDSRAPAGVTIEAKDCPATPVRG